MVDSSESGGERYFERLGMVRDPFSMEVDSSFFYPTREHMGVIRRIDLALRADARINPILGEEGMGKTLLCRVISERIAAGGKNFLLGTISRPVFPTEFRLFQALAERMDIGISFRSTLEYRHGISDALVRRSIEGGQTPVLVVASGEEMNFASLMDLLGLMEARFAGSSLLPLVIFGESRLLERIQRVEGSEGRLNPAYTVNPLEPEEMQEVILHRLSTAGYPDSSGLFDEPAFAEIWRLSRGSPSRANRLCRRSLLAVTSRPGRVVGSEAVRRAARQCDNGR